ncbi:FAD-dependent oxidoreductase [Streptomyces sp. PsTaAH-124]|uniref:FAD-dependent oxidoreductase n=1 Tax=Streptomyces sp. PsTaAH-124 TaxID=1157638 RepID=UPI000477C17C|nr:FAD-dependent oxidoreductase [Streptomyces sp. PsTaAH-124]
MTRWDAETAVVGLGSWGASALWRLAARGVDVIGLERFTPGHALGSSSGGARMVRLTGAEHPGLLPLARRSRQLWAELARAGQDGLFTPCGGLLIGPESGPLAGGALRTARAHGVPVRTFTATALRFRFPRHTGVPAHHIGVWEPSAGLVRPRRAVRAAVALAERAGARVHTDSRVVRVERVPGGVRLHTATGSVTARQAVLTAGAWLPGLVPGLPVQPVRAPFSRFRPLDVADSGFDLEGFPVFRRELDDGRILWGSGAQGGDDVGLGLEDGGAAKPVDPEDTDRSVTADDWSDLARVLPAKVPGLETLPVRTAVGTRTRTPDGLFVCGRPGGDPRLVVAGGGGADSAAYAPGVGDALADLVQGAAGAAGLDFLSPDRFG